ncbi:DUF4390 domain-containing protein [Neisseria leonii]|uniref:DUF4390 domain-containing protein n=1 Tax=Neisseria leonii TaxID=2995413 RepID=A0A9X4E5N1_9NEIS|nr:MULTISPECIES: DUF4390 domain-containing protein [unclassified Neisseria]MDD9325746.1 DUF4390 domain-containing protein [Neisseria sp. 3986]MDD9327887.1 DUF4390 domain-containing protein [Neisseria sp. 51.81]
MAFITHLSAKTKTAAAVLAVLPLVFLPHMAAAESITVVRAAGTVTPSGQMDVGSRFQTALPESLQTALRQGVPLHFTLDYRLSRPTLPAYRFRLGQLVGSDYSVAYRLSYHPLTNRYRVTVGTFSSDYNSLDTALRGIGAIANWRVLPPDTLSGYETRRIKAEVRLSLSTAQLPKPFQINSITAQNWQLDSGWKALNISGN